MKSELVEHGVSVLLASAENGKQSMYQRLHLDRFGTEYVLDSLLKYSLEDQQDTLRSALEDKEAASSTSMQQLMFFERQTLCEADEQRERSHIENEYVSFRKGNVEMEQLSSLTVRRSLLEKREARCMAALRQRFVQEIHGEDEQPSSPHLQRLLSRAVSHNSIDGALYSQ